MIYYFSGTGNSYQVAKLLAYLTQDKMQDISTLKDYKHDDSVMGFVFPVHCYDVLDLMQDFIRKLEIKRDKKIYCYVVVTCGGKVGNTFITMQDLLKVKNIELAYRNEVYLPDNILSFWGKKYNYNLLNTYKDKVLKIAEELNQRKTNNNVLVKKSWWYVIKKYISWLFIKKCLQKKTVKKNCIHCKRCVKLCPTNNIIEEAGKIKFKSNNNCIYCLACIQWCPMQAINFGSYNLKDKQYHHPEVVENELFKRW